MAGWVERAGLASYESLYISVSESDALLSCAGRIHAERVRGGKTLVVCLGGRPGSQTDDHREFDQALAILGTDLLFLDEPVSEGLPLSKSLRDQGGDEQKLLRALEEVRQKTLPRHVYLPLGVGGLLPHRVAHEVGLRVFTGITACDVFLYEERPAAFIPGTARLRLAQIGASLPPGAWQVRGALLLRTLWGLQRAPYLAPLLRSWSERVSAGFVVGRQWAVSRTWRPQKAFGPRLQPVFQEMSSSAREVPFVFKSRFRSLFGSRRRFGSALKGYTRSLGRGGEAERYWLVLPERLTAGVALSAIPESPAAREQA